MGLYTDSLEENLRVYLELEKRSKSERQEFFCGAVGADAGYSDILEENMTPLCGP